MTELRKLSCKIKQLAYQNNISDKKLAEILGISASDLTKVYLGEYVLSRSQLSELADYTKVDMDSILDISDIDEKTYCRVLSGCECVKASTLDELLNITSDYINIREAIEFHNKNS